LPLADAAAPPSPEVGVAGPQGLTRRDFLLAAGFTFAGLSGCQRAPVQYALPYLNQPEEVVPGRPYYYASTCVGCAAACGLLVKNRDGRPLKLEGNPEHPLSQGGLCAVGQASILGLYDRLRLPGPRRAGSPVDWPHVDQVVRDHLERARRHGKPVRILSRTILSPTERALVERLVQSFADGRHVVHDPLSASAILEAHERTHGLRLLPHFRFERADVIASFDADFLGTWIAPVEFTAGYASRRNLEGMPPRLSYHVQFESRLSLSGCQADQRVCLAPAELGWALSELAGRLRQKAALPGAWPRSADAPWAGLLDDLADRLWRARGRSLVLCGSPDVALQSLCNLANHLLGNYGTTVDIERPSLQRQGDDRQLHRLLAEIRQGQVEVLLILGGNPVAELPEGDWLAEAFQRIPLVVSCSERLDETSSAAQVVCPPPHFLEAWGDAEPVSGLVGVLQPVVRLPGDRRPVSESLAAWLGAPRPAYDLLRDHWREHIFPRRTREVSFQAFWDQAVHDGFVSIQPLPTASRPFAGDAIVALPRPTPPAGDSWTLLLYPKVAMLDGSHAYNPWLQELPDPVSKVTWDNYASVSPAAAERLGVAEGDLIRLQVPGEEGEIAVELPVFIQPGQHDTVIAAALGYGRQISERFAQVGPRWLEGRPTLNSAGRVGRNVAPLLAWHHEQLEPVRAGVQVRRTSRTHPLASTQRHPTLSVPPHLAPPGKEVRPIIRETTRAEYQRDLARHGGADGGRPPPPHAPAAHAGLWPDDHPVSGHRWGMVIDLNACTGCSACVIACQVENNIPVVGKDEIRRQREMHWLRIDRYYAGEGSEIDVAFQPMLCQHCGNAPCETVCPVLATVHSAEGLNQQVYNRCVGTRYCANNCPYKVRRFNWFDYPHADTLHNLVLNPDVTVRSRGVMEKCTFCVQRIEAARIAAARRGQAIADGAVQPACQQSCPARAIVFGDRNNPRSALAQREASPRYYRVLEELNVRPSVGYLARVRHGPASAEEEPDA
jgi:molybdopterin-containing oxidoreductase family iron-sulfur binding subunit